MKILGRLITALITPFEENGKVDYEKAGKLASALLDSGSDGFVVSGTTGEGSTLNQGEKLQLFQEIKSAVGDKGTVIAATGNYNTAESVELSRKAVKTGVDGLLLVVPYYNKPTQRGLFQHFKEIATCSPIPVIIYNVPGRASCNISAETCLELAHGCENIVAVKEASGDLSQIMKIIKGKPENFLVISGDDMLTIPVIAAGGSGVISVLANAYPAQCTELVSQSLKSNFKSARELQFRFLEMIELLFIEGNPSGVKEMLSIMNICHNYVRLPLVPVSRTVHTRIQKAIEEINKS